MARWRTLGDGFGMVIGRRESRDGQLRRLRILRLDRGRYELHVLAGATLRREREPELFPSERTAKAAAAQYLQAESRKT